MSSSPPQQPVEAVASHLLRVAEEGARARRGTVPLRVVTTAAVCMVALSHAAVHPARYMWVAPLLAFAGWSLDVTLGRRAAAFERLAASLRAGGRPPAFTLDPTPYEPEVSARSQWFEPARALYYGTLATLAAGVAVDAQRFPASESLQEVLWFLLVSVAALVLLGLIAWSWWLDRFQPAAASAPRELTPPAASGPSPAVSVSALGAGSPGPFPPRPVRPPEERPVPAVPPVSCAPAPGPFPVRAEPVDIVRDDPRPSDPPSAGEPPTAPRTSIPTSTFGTPPAAE